MSYSLMSACLFDRLTVCLFVPLSFCLFVCLYVCLSVCLSVCLYVCLFFVFFAAVFFKNYFVGLNRCGGAYNKNRCCLKLLWLEKQGPMTNNTKCTQGCRIQLGTSVLGNADRPLGQDKGIMQEGHAAGVMGKRSVTGIYIICLYI